MTAVHVMVVLVLLQNTIPRVQGLTLHLSGHDLIPTDGSANIPITDISDDDNVERALICQSDTPAVARSGNWYLHPTQPTTDDKYKIASAEDDDRGWFMNRAVDINGHRLIRLRRGSAPKEGVFTCHVPGDSNTPVSVGIYYPIVAVSVSVEVLSVRKGTFRVTCTATGGTVSTSSFTGPGGVDLVLRPLGTVGRTGQNTYSVTSGTLSGRSNGDTYPCTAANGVSSPAPSDNTVLTVATNPIVALVDQISPTVVRVEWIQPSGGATVTGYVIHYGAGTGVGTKAVTASSSRTDITGLTSGLTYTISVEATSGQLSGECDDVTILLITALEAPISVTVSDVGSTSVTVSWQAVEDADKYTVIFTQTRRDVQLGLCRWASHTANISVATTSARIVVGLDVGPDDNAMLRAYTTYSVTVVAESDVRFSSGDSEPIAVTTAQTSAAVAPRNVMTIVESSTAISVQWDGLTPCRLANGHIIKYRVQYTAVSSGEVKTVDHSGEWNIVGAETLLTELTPFTNYSIQVAAVNEQGDVGPYRSTPTAQTEEDAPGLIIITPFPSFFNITITWDPPAIPNGIIIAYELSYRPRDSSQPDIRLNTTDLATSFTTQSDLPLRTEFIFYVKAYTKIGPGDTATVVVSTLDRPPAVEGVDVKVVNDTSVAVSWNVVIIPGFSIDYYTLVYSQASHFRRQDEEMLPSPTTSFLITDLKSTDTYQLQVFATVIVDGRILNGERSSPVYFTRPPVVQGVEVTALDGTSVTISWGVLIIPFFSIDYYTVVYSQREDGETSVQFPPPATSGVITDLDSTVIYRFQVFATITVSDRKLEGGRSSPMYFVYGEKRISDSESCSNETTESCSNETTAPIMIGVIAGVVVGVLVGGSGLIIALFIANNQRSKSAARGTRVSTDDNPAYGVSGSSTTSARSTSAYEMYNVDSKQPHETIYDTIA